MSNNAIDEPGTARHDAETNRTAIVTGPAVTAGEYFVYHPDHGGQYSDGVAEGVADWALLTPVADLSQ